jgi:hypothetical protein
MNITGSTPDEVIKGLFKKESELLAHFDEVRKTANAADAERDRLRDYIKDNIEPGRYDNVLFSYRNAGSRAYANSSGLNALENYVIVAPTEFNQECVPEDGEVTIRNHAGEIVWRGKVVVNADLFKRQQQQNVVISLIPE